MARSPKEIMRWFVQEAVRRGYRYERSLEGDEEITRLFRPNGTLAMQASRPRGEDSWEIDTPNPPQF